MSEGVVYYNVGEKMAVRLAVSVHTLRKVYDGPITILSEGMPSHAFCGPIAKRYGCNVQDTVFNATEGKNTTYLNACLVGEHTPYDTTVWLDSDTTIHRRFDELFEAANRNDFAIAQFADWKTKHKKHPEKLSKIGGRIECWRGILPDHWLQRAIEFGPAINCGVFAFNKRSSLVRDWHELARKGQFDSFIPDEVCCQIMLAQPEYKCEIMPQHFNCSCKYSDPWEDDVRIVHYHGRKHARFEGGHPQYNSDIWYAQFQQIRDWEIVQDYISKDRQLRNNLKEWDKWR